MVSKRQSRFSRGTTLTEVVIGAALASVIMISVWGLFSLSNRMFHSTRKRLVSLQGAFLLLERFNLDLASAYISDVSPVDVSSDFKKISFKYYDPSESDWESTDPKIALRGMEYSYDDSASHFLRKDGPSTRKAFKAAQFEVILYSVPTQKTPPRPYDQHVTFRITCAAADDIKVNKGLKDEDAKRRDKQVVTLISTAAFPQKASEVAFPWWVPNNEPKVKN